MCRVFLMMVLEMAGFPRTILNMVMAIYLLPLAWTNHSGNLQVFCWLSSGSLQGCPRSGSLWAPGWTR